MSYSIVYPNGEAVSVAVAANDILSVKTKGVARVYQVTSYVDRPSVRVLLLTVDNDEGQTSAFSAAGTVEIEAGAAEVHYTIGTDSQVLDEGMVRTNWVVGSLNATGTLTTALCLGGVVTSTTASAVTATLDTGALTDAGSNFDVGEGFMWSVVVTGATNALTVTAATGHTIVGEPVVAADSSGLFMTLKTAADTFVTYRMSGV